MSGEKGLALTVSGLLAIMVLTTALFFTGHANAAWLVGYLGTFVWMLFILGLIVFWDSRSRWPGVGWFDRLCRVLTLQR